MPKITELDSVISLDGNDVLPVVSKNNNNEDETMKVAINLIGTKLLNSNEYGALNTTDKKIIGAINEVNAKASQFDNMTDTASGAIASFDNGGDDIPVSEFECEIVAQQGSGTPSPSDPLPITGFSQADIVVTGKNLIDCASYVNSTSSNLIISAGSDGSINYNGTPSNTYAFLTSNFNYYLPSGTTVTFSRQQGFAYRHYLQITFDDNSSDTLIIENNTTSITTTFTKSIIKLQLILSGLSTSTNYNDNVKLMLNVGASALPYEQYTGNTYTVSFGQTIYGGRLIYANGQWSIQATHIMLNFSDFNFSASNPSSHVFRGDYSGIHKDNIKFPPNPQTATTAITEHYEAMAWQPISASDNGKFAVNDYGTVVRFVFIDNNYSTQSDFETARNNDKIVVPLVTPTIIPITSSTRVKTISGDNNIYSSTGDCELKYFTNKADSIAELIKAFVV